MKSQKRKTKGTSLFTPPTIQYKPATSSMLAGREKEKHLSVTLLDVNQTWAASECGILLQLRDHMVHIFTAACQYSQQHLKLNARSTLDASHEDTAHRVQYAALNQTVHQF